MYKVDEGALAAVGVFTSRPMRARRPRSLGPAKMSAIATYSPRAALGEAMVMSLRSQRQLRDEKPYDGDTLHSSCAVVGVDMEEEEEAEEASCCRYVYHAALRDGGDTHFVMVTTTSTLLVHWSRYEEATCCIRFPHFCVRRVEDEKNGTVALHMMSRVVRFACARDEDAAVLTDALRRAVEGQGALGWASFRERNAGCKVPSCS